MSDERPTAGGGSTQSGETGLLDLEADDIGRATIRTAIGIGGQRRPASATLTGHRRFATPRPAPNPLKEIEHVRSPSTLGVRTS